MRIIAGAAKGRRLRGPPAGTRPFMDRNREALFSSLGPDVVGTAVLDLYAGVGSLGLEALSRGAASATFVESSPQAVVALRENLAAVGLGGEVVVGDVADFVSGGRGRYDLVFVDPPYELPLASVEEVLAELVDRLNPEAVVVLHRRSGDRPPAIPATMSLIWERQYGDALIWRYTMTAEEAQP